MVTPSTPTVTQTWDRDVTLPDGDIANNKDLNRQAVTTGLRYANGPIGVALTYDQVRDRGLRLNSNGSYSQGDDTTIKSWNIGGSYDFEVVKAYLAFGQTRNGLFEGQTFGDLNNQALLGKGLKVNSYLVGLSAPVGAGTIMGSWTMADPSSAPDSFANSDWSLGNEEAAHFQPGLQPPTEQAHERVRNWFLRQERVLHA